MTENERARDGKVTARGPLVAALAYWAVVFAAGLILGTLRVLVLAPMAGETLSVVLEIPLMLAVSWIASRRICRRFAVPVRTWPRLLMGGAAFALLMSAEVALSVSAFGRTPGAWAASLATPAGLIGLAAQIGFGIIPALQAAIQPKV